MPDYHLLRVLIVQVTSGHIVTVGQTSGRIIETVRDPCRIVLLGIYAEWGSEWRTSQSFADNGPAHRVS